MKKSIFAFLILIPRIVVATPSDLSDALDYCATPASWATQRTIGMLTEQRPDSQHVRSKLLHRTALKEGAIPVTLGEWGPLYIQTIKVTVPFIDVKKAPKTIIVTSIISAEECSLSEPAYVDMTLAE